MLMLLALVLICAALRVQLMLGRPLLSLQYKQTIVACGGPRKHKICTIVIDVS